MRYCQHLIPVFLILFLLCRDGHAQQPGYNFHYITTADGLNDDIVSVITQDKYGYVWMATLGALNRYNGSTVERFTSHFGDSTSAPNGIPYALQSDFDGRLWIGYDFGLFEYDFEKNNFRKDSAFRDVYVQAIVPAPGNRLFLLTSRGFFCYNTKTGNKVSLQQTDTVLQHHPARALYLKNDELYIGSSNGFIIYNIQTAASRFIALPVTKPVVASKILADSKGNVWISDYGRFQLVRYNSKSGTADFISDHPVIKAAGKQTSFTDFAVGFNNELWIITALTGLIRYDLGNNQPEYVQDSKRHYYLRAIYAAKDGNVWLGSVNGGIYFHTKLNMFSTVYPLPEQTKSPLSRAMLEDRKGNWWFTTGEGISRYDPVTHQYSTWQNEQGKKDRIYFNSVRGITEDPEGVIWIATGKGINSYTPGESCLRFYTGKDSIPQAFYYCANRDSKGRIWFGTKDYDGLYYYETAEKKFHSLNAVPLLKSFSGKGVRIVYEDSKHRLWIGFNGAGLGMIDEAANLSRYWFNDNSTPNTVIGNFIIDIKEDKKGVIWVSSVNGVTGIDIEKNRYTWLDDKSFFKTNYTGPLAVDEQNRLWIGTATGLYVADEQRKRAGYFDEASGLAGISFNEHSGYVTRDGYFMMPTSKGFVRFNPNDYRPRQSEYGFYIAWIDLVNKRKPVSRLDEAFLRLNSNENFFTLGLEALNYNNSAQTWYAYKLDGLEDDWHYTQDPKAVYTSVPGGNYTFRYKASTNPGSWNVKEKLLHIHIDKLFYKTVGFWSLIGFIFLALLYFFYRYRLRQQQRVFSLENKAQLLEKEKALVMYENLKQHLNPHFLFNSLTSLSSLIRLDQEMAGDFLDKMSKVYRYILKNRDNEVVPLSEEIKFVQLYIDLQKTRFEKGLEVHMDIDEDCHHRKIAPVTLQNLVENAIKHNTADEGSPLVIRLFIDNDYLVVSNNLQKKKFVETSNRQGLANMESLYHYLNSRPMEIIEDEHYFTVKIPLL